jgi:P pilus assembly chaperone PapD
MGLLQLTSVLLLSFLLFQQAAAAGVDAWRSQIMYVSSQKQLKPAMHHFSS